MLLNYFQLAQKCCGLGIMSAEFTVQLCGLYAAALLQQVAELAGCLLVKDSLLLKEAESVGCQDFGPLV